MSGNPWRLNIFFSLTVVSDVSTFFMTRQISTSRELQSIANKCVLCARRRPLPLVARSLREFRSLHWFNALSSVLLTGDTIADHFLYVSRYSRQPHRRCCVLVCLPDTLMPIMEVESDVAPQTHRGSIDLRVLVSIHQLVLVPCACRLAIRFSRID